MSPPDQVSNLPFKQVCIVGGGNAAHALAALLPSRGIRTAWYTSYGDEAEKINAELTKHQTISAVFAPSNTPNGHIQGRPEIVSASTKDVIPTSDVLLLPTPSFAYAPILHEIRDHIRKGTFIGVTPGQGGFDWLAREILGESLFAEITFFAIMPMPFNCRITEFGHSVAVQTYKKHYRIGVVPESKKEKALAISRNNRRKAVEEYWTKSLKDNSGVYQKHLKFLEGNQSGYKESHEYVHSMSVADVAAGMSKYERVFSLGERRSKI